MLVSEVITAADVTYRATTTLGREVELRLLIDPDAATVSDAWARLSAAHPGVDPTSLEILIRRLPR